MSSALHRLQLDKRNIQDLSVKTCHSLSTISDCNLACILNFMNCRVQEVLLVFDRISEPNSLLIDVTSRYQYQCGNRLLFIST